MKTYQSFGTRKTSQQEPITNSNQVQNSAGGYAWAVDDWTRLDRFLILGSEGGTYYCGERKLTRQNAEAVLRCVQSDGIRAVNRIVEISESGRAPKNDPTLFALAMAAGEGNTETRKAALDNLPRVARIGTHLFHFLIYVQQFRGWGRGLREAVAKWYTDKDTDDLAYQVIKYRQRNGWSHRDAMRKAHPIPTNKTQKHLFHWVTQGKAKKKAPDYIHAFESAQTAETPKQICRLIRDHNLPREAIPTHFLNDPSVWGALLERMPITATIRNLGKMSAVGLLKPMSQHAKLVAERITTPIILKNARVHPLSILVALRTYQQGQGVKGSLVWNPVREVVDALNEAFYLSFGNVEPTNKRTMLALDVSGSMGFGTIAGMPGISPRVGSAAMSLVMANVEPQYMTVAFQRQLTPIDISPRQRLDDVIHRISGLPFGGTDCSLPMIYALRNKLEIDTFVIYTDSETWAGRSHPSQALTEYRQKTGINAKLVVVGMESNGFTIADPNDAGMLDVVGFDTATPQIISDFARS